MRPREHPGGLVLVERQDFATLARDTIRGTLPFPPDVLGSQGSLAISPDGRTF